ncbi:MAG: hypothetical protein SFX73_33205 [Kofleriaceae bacterium]|nr:hypothetical protein [Kofleriaceae bacterium]
MRNLFLLTSVVFGLGVGACGGGTNKWDELVGKQEGFKKQMCECKDKACTEKVQEDWRAYSMSMNGQLGKPSDAQLQKSSALDDEMSKCRKQFDAAAAPTPTTP